MVAQEPVKAAIWQCLNSYCYKDAIFLVERLFAEVRSEEILNLVGTCYFRSGYINRAYNMLKNHGFSSVQNKYLFAFFCFKLNKLGEAETSLLGNKSLFSISTDYGILAGSALQLLGQIYRKLDQKSKAAECFRESLRCNSFLWNSFEQLCQMGEKVDPLDYFKTTGPWKAGNAFSPHTELSPCDFNYKNRSSENMDPAKIGPLLTSTVISKPQQGETDKADTEISAPKKRGGGRARQRIIQSQPSDSPLTPNFGVLPADSPVTGLGSSPNFITPPISNLQAHLSKAPMKAPAKMTVMKKVERQSSFNTMCTPDSPEKNIITGLRRSNRLFDSSLKDMRKTPRVRFAENTKTTCTNARKSKSRLNRTTTTQPLTPTTQNIIQSSTKKEKVDKDLLIKDEKPTSIPISPIQQSANGLMALLQDMGKGYRALCSYDTKRAVQIFEALPANQQKTSWVMEQCALAHYEGGQMDKAEIYFQKVREIDPFYIDHGMAVYSTLLWLARKESDISYLAQELVDSNKDSAVSWCSMANCFSLQKEHDSAIKFLHRAVQLDPEFAYAYTLLGHEYVFIEDFDKALSCFRTALRYNERHYNAWYGIGMVYYKQENYRLAQMHYQQALKINPYNSVLLGHIAVTQHEVGETGKAMETVDRALHLNEKNALCKYHRARFLLEQGQLDKALAEFNEVKQIAPKDSLVYFMIGKVHEKRGESILAQQNFSWAMSLNPHGANNMIKEALNQLQSSYANDDDELLAEDTEELTEALNNDDAIMSDSQ